jgi:hypothetical protein
MGVCCVSGRRVFLTGRREGCWIPSGIFCERRRLTMKGAYATRFCYGYLRPSAPEELFFFFFFWQNMCELAEWRRLREKNK